MSPRVPWARIGEPAAPPPLDAARRDAGETGATAPQGGHRGVGGVGVREGQGARGRPLVGRGRGAANRTPGHGGARVYTKPNTITPRPPCLPGLQGFCGPSGCPPTRRKGVGHALCVDTATNRDRPRPPVQDDRYGGLKATNHAARVG